MKRENKVFIERAELLTTDGIKAVCLSDEEYKGYCKGRKDTENKFKEAIKEFMKEMVESESMSEELFISRLIINFEEIFGADLCSEVEE